MSLIFEIAAIEVADPGKVICITGNNISSGVVSSLEYKRLGNVIIVDADSLSDMPLSDRTTFLRTQIAEYFPEWADHNDVKRATEDIFFGSGSCFILAKFDEEKKYILPIIAYDRQFFPVNPSLESNIPYAELLKRIMLYHELGHLEAIINSDLSHSIFSNKSDKENYANLSALHALGTESPNLYSYGVTGLVAWQAYSYLFLNHFPACGYVAEADYSEYLLENDATLKDRLPSSTELRAYIRGINHVVMIWLFHNETCDEDVFDYRRSGDSNEAALYLLQHPDKRVFALTEILKKLRNDDYLDEHEHLSDGQLRLIERSLVGFSLFGSSDFPDKILAKDLKCEMESHQPNFPNQPKAQYSNVKNRIIFVHP